MITGNSNNLEYDRQWVNIPLFAYFDLCCDYPPAFVDGIEPFRQQSGIRGWRLTDDFTPRRIQVVQSGLVHANFIFQRLVMNQSRFTDIKGLEASHILSFDTADDTATELLLKYVNPCICFYLIPSNAQMENLLQTFSFTWLPY